MHHYVQQPRHGSNLNVLQQRNGWRRCGTYIHNGILLSHKKEWNNAICSNMDGPRDDHTEWSKSEKDKYHMIPLICGIHKKHDTNELTYKTETDSQI